MLNSAAAAARPKRVAWRSSMGGGGCVRPQQYPFPLSLFVLSLFSHPTFMSLSPESSILLFLSLLLSSPDIISAIWPPLP